MSDPLLIAATSELLEGWSGPVVVVDGDHLLECVHLGVAHGRDGWVALGELAIRPGAPVVDALQRPIGDVRIDMRRAEVRDRVARVLTAAEERPCGWNDALVEHAWQCDGFDLVWDEGRERRGLHGDLKVSEAATQALVALDWEADDDLADGSRRVDALALAVVWREVCGG